VHRGKVFKKGGKTRAASPLKEFIYFSLEPTQKNVVIGPVPFPGPVGVVPPILEYGGYIGRRANPRRLVRKLGDGGEIRVGGPVTTTSKRNREGVMVTYGRLRSQGQVERANRIQETLYGPLEFDAEDRKARPFMRPVFTVEKAKLSSMWTNAVK